MSDVLSLAEWEELVETSTLNFEWLGIDDPVREIDNQKSKLGTDYLREKLESIDPDQCRLESGYRALELLIRHRDLSEKNPDSEVKALERRDKNLGHIKKLKATLLKQAHEALHLQSPLKRLLNPTQFAIMWGDFDPRILCQFIYNPLKDPERIPTHFVILAQGIYQEFINDKSFIETDLIVYEEYKDLSTYEPVLREVDTRQFQKQFRNRSGDINMENYDFLTKKTKEIVEAETLWEQKRQEKWERFLEQDKFVSEYVKGEYKEKWKKEKERLKNKLNSNNFNNSHVSFILWASDHLKKLWLSNGIPIMPPQKLVEEFLLGNEEDRLLERFNPSDWVCKTPEEKKNLKGKWNRPMDAAKKWIYLPAGARERVNKE